MDSARPPRTPTTPIPRPRERFDELPSAFKNPAIPHFQLPSDLQIRSLAIGLLGLLAAVYLGLQVGEGAIKKVIGIFLVLGMAALLTRLGSRAWLIAVVGMNLDVPVPLTFGRNFSSAELTMMLLIAHGAFLHVLRRQKIVIFRKEYVWPLLYAGWALLVFIRNPTGLLSFGSDTVGLRFYFQIFLALGGFLVLANGTIAERDIRWFLGLGFSATVLNMLYARWNVGSFTADLTVWSADVPYYTWQQALGYPAGFLFTALVAHYPLSALLSLRRWYWWPVIATAFGVTLLSGKRMGLTGFIMAPVFASVLRRSFGPVVILLMGAALAIGILVLGQGRFFDLPLNAQRALSVLPGNWNPSANLGTTDEYRTLLREDALERIRENPWIGKGFALNVSDYWADYAATHGRRVITGILAGESWHNTWLGISATFGIPAALIWLGLVISMLTLSVRVARAFPEGDLRKTLAAMIFLEICVSLMGSWTGGHAATNAFNHWWYWALLFPLQRSLKDSPGTS